MKKNNSIDGFIPRRSVQPEPRATVMPARRQVSRENVRSVSELNQGSIRRSDAEQSPHFRTKSAQSQTYTAPRLRYGSKRIANDSSGINLKPKKSRKKKIILLFLVVLVIVVAMAAWFILSKVDKISNNVLTGGLAGLFNNKPLKKDEQGRTNLLVFGTDSRKPGDSDYQSRPPLTDSLMMISYDHNSQKVSMISVPRDLWVRLEKPCSVGYQSKINAVYYCGLENSNQDFAEATQVLARQMKQVLGFEAQYYVNMNFQAVIDLVDAVGGVEIEIDSPDPRGIYDPNSGNIKFANGPTGLMNGQTTLHLIRARNAEGGYGLSRSNYDREDNQRKVVMALVKKLTSNGTLSDPGKILKVIDAVGDNIKTNIATDELRSVVGMFSKIASQMQSSAMISISLVSATKTDNISGQSVVVPKGGAGNYQSIHQYISEQIKSATPKHEESTITILNGGEINGGAKLLADALDADFIVVEKVGNADRLIDEIGIIYLKRGLDKPKTMEYLKQKTGFRVADDQDYFAKYQSDVVIVLGRKFNKNSLK